MKKYYYKNAAGSDYGPLPLQVIQNLCRDGTITAETPVRPDDSEDWRPARQVIAMPGVAPRNKSAALPAFDVLSTVPNGKFLTAGAIIVAIQIGLTTIGLCFAIGFPWSIVPLLLGNLLFRGIAQLGRRGWTRPITICAFVLELLSAVGHISGLASPSDFQGMSSGVVQSAELVGLLVAVAACACFLLGFRAATAIDTATPVPASVSV